METLLPYLTHVLPNGGATLPPAVLRDLDLHPGDAVTISHRGGALVLEKTTPLNVDFNTGDIFDNPFATFTEWADPINDAYNNL